MPAAAQSPAPGTGGRRVVWRFVDGKPGHENQSRGLAQALAARLPLEVHDLPAPPAATALRYWLQGAYPPAAALPSAELLLGAGHGTHLPMLAARRARGGRIVVLMKPSLPVGWFDLCLIPLHDRPPRRANVIPTRGVLNAVTTTSDHRRDAGLILVGGPSAHYRWDQARVVQQIETILARDPRQWTLTTSRRTPPDSVAALQRLDGATLRVIPARDTGPEWLPAQLAGAGAVWITEDSVSMVYEALTSGAACGVLEVPRRRSGRVSAGIAQLQREGWVTPYGDWLQNTPLQPPPEPFNEAQRCAHLIGQRWLGL